MTNVFNSNGVDNLQGLPNSIDINSPIINLSNNIGVDETLALRLESSKTKYDILNQKANNINDIYKQTIINNDLDSLQEQLYQEDNKKIIQKNKNKEETIEALNKELPEYLKEQKSIKKQANKEKQKQIDIFNKELEAFLDEDRALDSIVEEINLEKANKENSIKKGLQEQDKKWIKDTHNQRQKELNEVFGGDEYLEKSKERILTPTQEEIDIKNNLNNKIEELQNAYNAELEKGPMSIETHNRLNNEALEATVEKKNYDNLKEYEKRKALYELEKSANEAAEKAAKEAAKKNLKKSAMRNLGHVTNGVFAVMDYKDAREAGNGVVKSVAKAGVEFAKGELLGGWYMAAMAAKAVPTLAINTIEGVNTMSRSMNSMQKRQVFGDAQFMDTQQLATMRQSGMELAKMSQYNLQQAMMGNEAEYMHRL